MKCQQKSGVFLNIDCQNTAKNTCSQCKKEVCKQHSHTLELQKFCEDCYWERFLFSKEYLDSYSSSSRSDTIFMASGSNSSSTSSSSPSSNEPESFGDGGEFSGGGAGASWTEGDMQSLSDTDGGNNLMSDNDDTFFYS